jgi:hypothetical protein
VPIAGLDWLAPVRSFRNFFGRYGTTSGSIRGVLNAIVPVAVVDRYRDDSEGSLFGLTATAIVPAGNYAAFVIGSPTEDWELLSARFGLFWYLNPPDWQFSNLMIYTPDTSYNPLQTPAPVGFYVPGLNTDWSYTLGSVVAIAGYNATLPPRFGYFPFESDDKGPSRLMNDTSYRTPGANFNPPLRVYRDVSLGLVVTSTFPRDVDASLSILYRIRPRTTDGPRTATP